MLTTVEGVYKNGKIELTEIPSDVQEGRVLVTFLEKKTSKAPKDLAQERPKKHIMRLGQFGGEHQSTEEDFNIFQWPSESND